MGHKILILVPGKNARGGITNYYAALKKHLGDDVIYCERGSRNWPQKAHIVKAFIRMLRDYINYTRLLLFREIDIVQTTTAFYKDAVLRDSIFIFIALVLQKKVVVFFRGWDDHFAYNLSGIYLFLIKKIYFKASAFIELSKKNLNHLKYLGYTRDIFLETTVVDINLLKTFDLDAGIHKRFHRLKKTILFLSRIEKEKGVYKILDIFKRLKEEDDCYQLVYAGDGNELAALRQTIRDQQIKDVHITGFVDGDKKRELFEEAGIFIFMSEFEGMPNAVLEAMAFGLPVITTNVGGISSVFSNMKNGLLIDNYDLATAVNYIKKLFLSHTEYQQISKENYKLAEQKFWSDKVAQRLKIIFEQV